ncbi:hypothetical protein T492DRAFT_1129239 [Pavlovales sp. CCMP2436]|nr:hypothetical protein T492DRAFT_1129239 [Pavlovales sp. CCMP2436]
MSQTRLLWAERPPQPRVASPSPCPASSSSSPGVANPELLVRRPAPAHRLPPAPAHARPRAAVERTPRLNSTVARGHGYLTSARRWAGDEVAVAAPAAAVPAAVTREARIGEHTRLAEHRLKDAVGAVHVAGPLAVVTGAEALSAKRAPATPKL